MSSRPAAEAPAVDKPASTPKPSGTRKPAPRKRTTAAGTTEPRKPRAAPKPKPVEIAAAVESVALAPAPAPRRRRLRPLVAVAVLVVAGVAAALFVVTRQDDAPAQSPGAADAVSAEQLAAFAGSHAGPVYWAGRRSDRTLELTSTDAGTFVRYLAGGSTVGGSGRSLTIGTYPLPQAYATAARRGEAKGMVARRLENGGIAVWSSVKPTSVYLAYRGVASLVEVYSPQASEARRLALSGLIRPVR